MTKRLTLPNGSSKEMDAALLDDISSEKFLECKMK